MAAWASRRETPPSTFLDLGSGGGLPGLVLLEIWRSQAVLLDSMAKRVAFLREVLAWPDAPGRARVEEGRAEDLARSAGLEALFPLVTSRSFGPPAVTAECAARFLVVGGLLVVSEPPEREERWSGKGLRELGLVDEGDFVHGLKFRILRKDAETPPQFPRRSGIPAKRPLF